MSFWLQKSCEQCESHTLCCRCERPEETGRVRKRLSRSAASLGQDRRLTNRRLGAEVEHTCENSGSRSQSSDNCRPHVTSWSSRRNGSSDQPALRGPAPLRESGRVQTFWPKPKASVDRDAGYGHCRLLDSRRKKRQIQPSRVAVQRHRKRPSPVWAAKPLSGRQRVWRTV